MAAVLCLRNVYVSSARSRGARARARAREGAREPGTTQKWSSVACCPDIASVTQPPAAMTQTIVDRMERNMDYR